MVDVYEAGCPRRDAIKQLKMIDAHLEIGNRVSAAALCESEGVRIRPARQPVIALITREQVRAVTPVEAVAPAITIKTGSVAEPSTSKLTVSAAVVDPVRVNSYTSRPEPSSGRCLHRQTVRERLS
jgi:hypothetical protein